jgi:hypothetical protein
VRYRNDERTASKKAKDLDEKFDWEEIYGPHFTSQDADLSEDFGDQGFCFSKLEVNPIIKKTLCSESESGERRTSDTSTELRGSLKHVSLVFGSSKASARARVSASKFVPENSRSDMVPGT